ncbi:MAG: hypothetical protein JNK48_28995 [Bryobacterales bacterium]|nr:hypothetical protein [Bryobacterales bacterium]
MRRRDLLLSAMLAPPRLSLATFDADITPPVGGPLFTGIARSIVDRLQARGLILHGAGQPVVILSLDWCEIRNDSYDLWRDRIAAAARTTRERVLLTCIHQHDAPYTDSYAQQLLTQNNVPDPLCDPAFETQTIARVAAAVQTARPRPITEIGAGQARIEQLVSNRRYLLPDGKVSFGRTSATRDPALRALPEGLTDPYLKTISFWDRSTPVAALSCFSIHPMSYYGQGDVTGDFPALARTLRQSQSPNIFQIYCSGASGDTIGGKYNDGTPATRLLMRDKLLQGMETAWKNTIRRPVSAASFRNTHLRFQPRDTGDFRIDAMQRILADPKEPRRRRFDAALGLSWRRRLQQNRPIDVPCLDFGAAAILLVPAEAFVQYQLWAQEERPQDFVVTLGYGECAPGYIPTQSNVDEGYDDHYSWVHLPSAERAFRTAIQKALHP